MKRSLYHRLTQDYTLNFRFIGRLLAIVAVLGIVTFGLNRYHSRKLSAAYLNQADLARDDDKPGVEQNYLRRYLALHPADQDVRLRLGLLQARLAVTPKERYNAFVTLQEVLRSNPNVSADIRLQCVQLALHPFVNLHDAAKFELEVLLKTDPENPKYHFLMADCLMRAKDYRQALVSLNTTIAKDPNNIPAYATLANLQRFQFNRFEEANNAIRDMLAKNPDSSEALIAEAEYWRAAKYRKEYEESLKKARTIAPDDPQVLLAASDFAQIRAEEARAAFKPDLQKAAYDESLSLLQRIIELYAAKLPPLDPPPLPGGPEERLIAIVSQAYHFLVQTALRLERFEQAETWARQQYTTFPKSLFSHYDLADALIARQKPEEASRILNELQNSGVAGGRLDFFRGRILALEGRWIEACRKLEAAIKGLTDDMDQYRRANVLLAAAYQQTGELDRRYEAFRRAVPEEPLDPLWGVALSGVAESLMQLGRWNDAIVEYQRLAVLAPGANVPLARLLMNQQLALPKAQRDWTAVERAVNAAPAGLDKELLRAEWTALKGQPAEAQPLLEKLIAENPDSLPVHLLRIRLELQAEHYDQVRTLLEQSQSQFGDRLELRLVRIRMAMLQGGDTALKELQNQAHTAEALPESDRYPLYRNLIAAVQTLDRRDLARQWIDQLIALKPQDLTVQNIRFDLALLDGDEAVMQDAIAKIANLTGGPDTIPSRVPRAFYLIWKAEKTKDPQVISQASELLAGMDRLRPGWSRLYLAEGQIAFLKGDLAAASRAYRKAIDMGERSPELIERLLALYSQTRQYTEADTLLKNLPQSARPTTAQGAELMAEVSLGAKNYALAAEQAKKAVAADSQNPDKLIWLARVLMLSGQIADAEAPLRQVIKLDPKKPEAWIALVQVLQTLNRRPDADQLVKEAAQAIPEQDRAFVLAQIAELQGNQEQAVQLYEQALKARPGDALVLRQASSYMLRSGKTPRAKELLESLLALGTRSKDDEVFARRLLAVVLASDRDYRVAQRAIETLGLSSADDATKLTGQESVEDLRARIFVFAQLRGRRYREQAVRLFEAMETRFPLTTEDKFLLAGLHDSLGEWEKARARYTAAVSAQDATKDMLATLIVKLLIRKETSVARTWLNRLSAQEPNTDRLRSLEVRYLAADKQPEAAVKKATEIQRPEIAAMVLEQSGLVSQAEPFFRQFAEKEKTPQSRLGYIGYLGRSGNLNRAWSELKSLWGDIPIQVAVGMTCEIWLHNASNASALEQSEMMGKIVEAANKDNTLAVYKAMALSLSGEQSAAIALNQEVLSRDPNNVVALNNQAFLLALHEKRYDDALVLIRRAIQQMGPVPSLLDTEGLILIHKEDYAQAVQLLRDAVTEDPSPVTLVHLAFAQYRAKQIYDAILALQDARRRNLRMGEFHPLEHQEINAVIQEIENR